MLRFWKLAMMKQGNQSNEQSYTPETDARNNTLTSYTKLAYLISSFNDHNLYFKVSMILYNKLYSTYGVDAKDMCKQWCIDKYKDKSEQIDYNWDTYWPSRTVEKKIGLNTLKKLAEESDPEGYKKWCQEYSWSPIKKLLKNFTEVDVKEFIVLNKQKDVVYNSATHLWYIWNPVTKLWDSSEDNCVVIDFVTNFVRGEMNKLAKSDWAKKTEMKTDKNGKEKEITPNQDLINSCVDKIQ